MTFKYAKEVKDIINEKVYGQPKRKQSSKPITPSSPLNSETNILDCEPLETDGQGNFVLSLDGRKITLKGINVDSAMKLPVEPFMPSYLGNADEHDNIFFDGDNVSFVGRPFPLEEAALHFQRIKSWGYNNVRYLVTWEALEHQGPGIYDEDFINYTLQVLEIIDQVGGLYIYLELHQDVWSRFSGGSGSPMWTLYAAGLEPRRFAKTEAAILHNQSRFQEEQERYPKMLWVSNYKRLAAQTMFTMFFSGKDYFPELEINNVNIQEYLQSHYFNATAHLWQRVNDKLPHLIKKGTILGFELMNEPNLGYFGMSDITSIPACQQLRVGTTPTAFQSMKLGMGLPCEVDEYKITITGPQKFGTKLVDPEGARAWLSPEEAVSIDKKYGWKRSPLWKLGECIYADLKVWSGQTTNLSELTLQERLKLSEEAVALDPSFFSSPKRFNSNKKIDNEYFINNNFIDFYLRFKKLTRKICPNAFVFMQPPVLEAPPNVKTDPRHVIDSKTVYCPHYYDGMSLMFKTWNTKFNVDTLGIMRGRYLNPVLGIVFGEKAIRNCIKGQFLEIRAECEENLGSIPTLMSETGMPYDMDKKKSYSDGKYISQTGALDALSYALEGLNMSHSYWCYTSVNCHDKGDRWNNEDFSFWSPEDRNLQFDEIDSQSSSRRGSIRSSIKSRLPSDPAGMIKSRIQRALSVQETTTSKTDDSDLEDVLSVQALSLASTPGRHSRKCYPSADGVRAASAVIRPYALATMGQILDAEFDLKSGKFSLSIKIEGKIDLTIPTVIFVPKWHYPCLNHGDIELTSGYLRYNERLEYLEWFHLYDPVLFVEEDEESVSPTGTATPLLDSSASSIAFATHVESIVIHNNGGGMENGRESLSFGECRVS